MWYVAQVFTGEEETIKQLCAKQISSAVLEKCFIPYSEQMKRYKGKWHKEKEILFPGYVFLITEQVEILWNALQKIPWFTRILGDTDHLLPLTDSEVALMERLGGKEQVVAMSVGVIENDAVRIIDGPMKGMEGCIEKIDRHKREARIKVEMFGRMVDTTVGMEIIRKV